MTAPEPVTRTVTEVRVPPAAFMAPCPEPAFVGRTNRDLVDWATELRSALAACNVDKLMLRSWADEHESD